MQEQTPPKVFISHASEDKERFVLSFAAELRAKGVDAWLDKWEIHPGDSLVDKVFEHGIGKADAFIVVLSTVSVVKPWVREELDAAMVRKIEKSTRLIPIVIDDCEVPEALKHVLWLKVPELGVETTISRIVNSLFGLSEKPPIGAIPTHASAQFVIFSSQLTHQDNLVLDALCEAQLGGAARHNPEALCESMDGLGVSRNEVNESLEILEQHGFVKNHFVIGGGIHCIDITPSAFDLFLRQRLSDYDGALRRISASICNDSVQDNWEVESATGLPPVVVDHFLKILEYNGQITVTRYIGGRIGINNVHASLRRSLRG